MIDVISQQIFNKIKRQFSGITFGWENLSKEFVLPELNFSDDSLSDFEKRIISSLTLFAYGDAYGYVTEFMKYSQIMKKQPSVPKLLKVSDDTQMSLYTMKAVFELSQEYDFVKHDTNMVSLKTDTELQNIVRKKFADTYVEFACDPDNDRAPGKTTLLSLSKYQRSQRVTGLEGSISNFSLGCGTVMRVPWLGLLPYDRETIAMLAFLSAQTTHGDPKGWIISALLAVIVHDILHGGISDNMFSFAYTVIDDVFNLLPDDLISSCGNRFVDKELLFSEIGGDLRHHLRTVVDAETDLNDVFGQGWIADEALYNVLAAVSFYGMETENAVFSGVKRLVYSHGDSDSMAAISGSLFGAGFALDHNGITDLLGSMESRYQYEIRKCMSFIITENRRR